MQEKYEKTKRNCLVCELEPVILFYSLDIEKCFGAGKVTSALGNSLPGSFFDHPTSCMEAMLEHKYLVIRNDVCMSDELGIPRSRSFKFLLCQN